jgi:hypothetical protein
MGKNTFDKRAPYLQCLDLLDAIGETLLKIEYQL